MPGPTTIYAAFDQLERNGSPRDQRRARMAKRALGQMVGDQLAEEVATPSTRLLTLPSGRTIEITRFE